MTYKELEKIARKNGDNLADCAIGRMMVVEEEGTGVQQNWEDEAPDWIEKQFVKRGRK